MPDAFGWSSSSKNVFLHIFGHDVAVIFDLDFHVLNTALVNIFDHQQNPVMFTLMVIWIQNGIFAHIWSC